MPGRCEAWLLLLGRARRLLVRVGDDRRRIEQAGGVVRAAVDALRALGVLRGAGEDVGGLVAFAALAARPPLCVCALVYGGRGGPGRAGPRGGGVWVSPHARG